MGGTSPPFLLFYINVEAQKSNRYLQLLISICSRRRKSEFISPPQ